MDFDLSILDGSGIDCQTGMAYTGNKDKFISALQRYYNNYEKNRSKVEDFYEKEDYENYMIIVHSLKSNSKMIGATDLSKLFEELEMAARNNDIATVGEKTAACLKAYEDLYTALQPVGQMEQVRAADEISADEARDTVEKLLAALDDFDDELSNDLVKKLSGYPFRLTQRDKLKEASEHIENFMYDDAAEIIKEIAGTIE
ncbi:MAG: Hpt domain-containing protein [Lachnospiraceae bacterium]|nr:Hpt domain-containing protein [Lachnospiraceae bacterium]